MGKHFWSFRASAGGTAPPELVLYGEIADATWWGDEVTPAAFNDELKGLGNVDELLVRINSPGGDVFAAQAIYTMLRQHSAKVTVRVDGLAASAATLILMAGDTIQMPANAMLMVHNPWTLTAGDANDLRGMADTLDAVRDSMLAAYTARTGRTADEIIPLLDAETWLTAERAKELGFADEVLPLERVNARLRGQGKWTVNGQTFDLSRFAEQPIALLIEPETPEAGNDVDAVADSAVASADAADDAALPPDNAEAPVPVGDADTEAPAVKAREATDTDREAERRARILTIHRSRL